MPKKPERIEVIRSMLKNSSSAYYPDFRNKSFYIEYYRELGFTDYPLTEEYKRYDALSFDDIENFYEANIRNRPTCVTIYWDKSRMDVEKLRKLGKLVELKHRDIIVD